MQILPFSLFETLKEKTQCKLLHLLLFAHFVKHSSKKNYFINRGFVFNSLLNVKLFLKSPYLHIGENVCHNLFKIHSVTITQKYNNSEIKINEDKIKTINTKTKTVSK